MTVLITLTAAGLDSGPFDLYSNLDGYTTPFETGVFKASLLAGYSSALVPDYTIFIRVVSIGVCTNFIDIRIDELPIYEISGCRSDVSFFANGTFPYSLGDIVFFFSNNPIDPTLYCGTIINILPSGSPNISLSGTQPTDCGDETCGDDFDIIL